MASSTRSAEKKTNLSILPRRRRKTGEIMLQWHGRMRGLNGERQRERKKTQGCIHQACTGANWTRPARINISESSKSLWSDGPRINNIHTKEIKRRASITMGSTPLDNIQESSAVWLSADAGSIRNANYGGK